MECPVCLEELTGTIVHLGCCKNQVHIQCYVSKCPLCRAELPIPHMPEPSHVIVPVPVPLYRTQSKITVIIPAIGTILGIGILFIFVSGSY
jgi:hypothetical protein